MKLFLTLFLLSLFVLMRAPQIEAAQLPWWDVQAIDTMKFSRDPSRQYLTDQNTLNQVSDSQVKAIAQTGATYVVIDTPYDDEFLPVLETWVAAARKYNLHVWFKGNWSGWEGWFGYAPITRDQHLQKTQTFITTHPDLFQDGDIFSACPECENGGPGDPRMNGDVAGHRAFLIQEYQMMSAAFRTIGKNVQVNYNSMNADVAELVMDKPTTEALGGIVVIDHYVNSPTELNYDVSKIAQNSGGKVVLGEFGAPIPDINGDMTPDQQADWIKQSLNLLAVNPDLIGVNYWTSVGGSTALWSDNGQAKPAVAVIQSYFTPKAVSGKVVDTIGEPINEAVLQSDQKRVVANNGQYQLAYVNPDGNVSISAQGYSAQQTTISQLVDQPTVTLNPIHPDLWYRFRSWVRNLFN